MAKAYKNWTIQERMASMLLATGHAEVESRGGSASSTGKYRVFFKRDEGHLFLGKGGAIRRNWVKPTIANSIDVAERFKMKLREYELANGLT